MLTLTAFVASHSSLLDRDGTDYQELTCTIARELRISASGMAEHPASPDLKTRCLKSVAACDIFILIVSWRYGALHDGIRSLTEIEYDAALKAQKAIVVMLDDTPPPSTLDADELARATRFRARLDKPGERPLYATYHGAEGFAVEIRKALIEIVNEQSHRLLRHDSQGVHAIVARALAVLQRLDRVRVSRSALLTTVAADPYLESAPGHMLDSIGMTAVDSTRTVTTRTTAAERCFPAHTRLLVVGEYGLGKTSFLRLLEQRASEELLANHRAWKIPLYVDLSDWNTENTSFRGFVDAAGRRIYGGLVALEDVFVLLDGIDNRAQALDTESRNQIVDWIRQQGTAWIAIAARQRDGLVAQVLDALPDLPFAVVELERLTAETARQLVERNMEPGSAQDRVLSILDEAERTGNEHIARMLQLPEHLKLLTLIHRPSVDSPTSTATLLRSWLASGFTKEKGTRTDVAYAEFISYVGSLAYRALRGRVREGRAFTAPMPRRDAVAFYRRAAATLSVFDLRGASQRIASWKGTPLSYFAAEYLLANREHLATLAPAPVIVHGRRVEQRFDSALHALVQLDPTAIRDVAEVDPCLAAACLSDLEAVDVPGAALTIMDEVIELLAVREHDGGAEDNVNAAVADAIRAVGHRADDLLREAMGSDEYWYRKRVVRVLRRVGSETSVELIVRALADRKLVADVAELAVLAFEPDQHAMAATFVASLQRPEADDRLHLAVTRLAELLPDLRPIVSRVLGIELQQPAPAVEEETEPHADGPGGLSGTGSGLAIRIRDQPGNMAIASRGVAWLERSAFTDGEWTSLWMALWDTGKQSAGVESLGRRWLAGSPETARGWGGVWTRLYKREPEDGEPKTQGIAWLHNCPRDAGWPHVWRTLADGAPNDETISALGYNWLVQTEHAAWSWGLVWMRLIDSRPQADIPILRRAAQRLLRRTRTADRSWGHVWPRLFDMQQGDNEIFALGISWLFEAEPNHPGWGLVWRRLWNVCLNSPGLKATRLQLDSLGRWWLYSVSPATGYWLQVWEGLWNAYPNDHGLRDAAIEWLEKISHQEKPPDTTGVIGWGTVWAYLWGVATEDERPDLIATALGVLAKSDDAISWRIAWRAIFPVIGRDPKLVQLANGWLANRASHRIEDVWFEIAGALNTGGALASDLKPALDGGSATPPAHIALERTFSLSRSWRERWERAWARTKERSHLVTLGLKWLTLDLDAPEPSTFWPHIWRKLFELGSEESEVLDLGVRWLATGSSSRSSWGLVWRGVASHGRATPEQIIEAIRWTDPSHHTRGTWTSVWLTLWDMGLTDRATLVQSAVAWLTLPDQARRDYPDVWCRLWDATVEPETLRVIGLSFCKLASSHDGWGSVATRLRDQPGFDDELRGRLAEWSAKHLGHLPETSRQAIRRPDD